MAHDNHTHESPKRVYFGIPIGFALAFWLIVFLSLKACDNNHGGNCCGKSECSKECMDKCKAEGKDCKNACCHDGENREVPKAAYDEPSSKEEVKGKEGELAPKNDDDKKVPEQGNNSTEGGKTGGTGEAQKPH